MKKVTIFIPFHSEKEVIIDTVMLHMRPGKELRVSGPNEIEISDGYHTFDELYDHRIELFIKLCEYIDAYEPEQPVWRSKLHSDGSSFEGWFILGINKEAGKQITYHLPLSYWTRTGFVTSIDRAPEWDKHTPADVLNRLKNL